MSLIGALSLGVVLATGSQVVYKCQEKGAITYTDRPCSKTAEAATLPQIVVTAPPARVQLDLAREHDARLARDLDERNRADAEWLKQHAAAKQAAAAQPKAKARTKSEPRRRRGP